MNENDLDQEPANQQSDMDFSSALGDLFGPDTGPPTKTSEAVTEDPDSAYLEPVKPAVEDSPADEGGATAADPDPAPDQDDPLAQRLQEIEARERALKLAQIRQKVAEGKLLAGLSPETKQFVHRDLGPLIMKELKGRAEAVVQDYGGVFAQTFGPLTSLTEADFDDPERVIQQIRHAVGSYAKKLMELDQPIKDTGKRFAGVAATTVARNFELRTADRSKKEVVEKAQEKLGGIFLSTLEATREELGIGTKEAAEVLYKRAAQYRMAGATAEEAVEKVFQEERALHAARVAEKKAAQTRRKGAYQFGGGPPSGGKASGDVFQEALSSLF